MSTPPPHPDVSGTELARGWQPVSSTNQTGTATGNQKGPTVATLTVRTLGAVLSELPPDMEIFISTDFEGSGYRNLNSADESMIALGGLARRVLLLWPGDRLSDEAGSLAEAALTQLHEEIAEDQPSSEEMQAAARIMRGLEQGRQPSGKL